MPRDRRGLTANESIPAAPQAQSTTSKPAAKPNPPRPWWWYVTPAGLANEARYRAEQIQRINKGTTYMGRVGIMPVYMDPRGQLGTSTPSQRDIVRGAAQVPLDAAKLGVNVVQRVTNGNKAADPATNPVGRAIASVERGLTAGMQLPQPEQRKPEDLFWQQMGNQFTTGALGAAVGGGVVGANAFTQGVFRSLSPALQQALRWTAGTGIESLVSTALTDNRQGNPANMLGDDAPMAVQPTDDMVSSMFKSFIPNAGLELGFSLGALGVGRGLNNVTRRVWEGRAVSEQQAARNWAQENGVQVENDGQYEFTPETAQPAAKAEAPAADAPAPEAPAPEAPSQPKTQQDAENMLLGPEEDAPVYDPATPEVDVAIQGLERLDDERLQQLATGDGPVLPELDRQLGEQQAGFQVEEGLHAGLFTAPTENLANPMVSYEAQWQQLPQNTLMSLAAPQNSPRLFRAIQDLTGREFEEFTRADVIEGLKILQAEGQTVLPNRLLSRGDTMDVESIQVDPQRFQFKDNVNAEGQQKGNSLEGVNKWNTDAEGVIQVWDDPADGQTYVVNGHNRLAKAKELGIPSIRTESLLATTSEQARAQGAISNIAQGAGTPFDAAKVIKELGITDPAGLEAAGIPLQSGLGVQGLALSKLPDNLFQAAINGELPMGRALALGGSGLDPEGMTRVVQLAQGRDMTDRAFAELTQMASTAPKVESDQMGLFGPETIDTTVIKAELAGKIRAELTSNKNLFKKVGRGKNATKLSEKAGTEVNTAQAQDAAGTAEAVLAEFDQTKYAAETPISQLLNEGAAEIAAGAKPAVVVKRILQQLEQAAETSPPAPKAPVEEPAVVDGGLSQREIEKYSQMSPEDLAKEKALADKYLLKDKALANRQQQLTAIQENEAQVQEYLDLSPGSNSGRELTEEAFLARYGEDINQHPQLIPSQQFNKVQRDLERHAWAQAFNQWYDENVTGVPLTPEARNELKKQVVTRAIQGGEVRPSESLLPELPEGPRNLNDPVTALQDEVRLAEHYAQQDAIRQQVELEAQRAAIGYDDMPLEEKKANGMLDTWEMLKPGSPLFHGTTEAGQKGIMANGFRVSNAESAGTVLGEGVYFASNERYASAYGGKTVWGELPPEAKILDLRAQGKTVGDLAKDAGVTGGLEAYGGDVRLTYEQQQQVKDWALANGYDGIRFRSFDTPGKPELETVIYNVDLANRLVGSKAAELSDIQLEQDVIRYMDLNPASARQQGVLREVVTEAIQRIAGDDATIALHGYSMEIERPKAWGGGGKKTRQLGSYELVEDIVNVRGFLDRSPDKVISTAYHESFHRIQFALMTQADMDAFDSVFGKIRVENYAGTSRQLATIERQAVAFQRFAEAKANGMTTAEDMKTRIRYEIVDALDEQFPRKDGNSWDNTFTGKAAARILYAFDRLLNFIERVNNGIRGRGFTSVEDFFEQAYAGDIAKKRAVDFALEAITPDQQAREARLKIWVNDNKAALSDISQVITSIDDQINALKAQAIAGGC